MKFELEPYNRGECDATLLDDLRRVARSLGRDYVTKDEYNEHGRWCAATFQKRFGSWCKAHDLAGLKRLRNYDATREECLADIKRVADKLSKTEYMTFTTREYDRHGRFNSCLIRRRCGSWNAALKRLSLTPSAAGQRITDEELFENLERLWEALGRQPRRADFRKPLSRYCYDAYTRRFGGSFRKALEAFVASFANQESGQYVDPTDGTAVDMLRVVAPKRHKTSRTISWRMRFLIMRRDDFKCRICGTSPAMKPGTVLVVDHILPWTDGGETVMENLQTLCEPCNGGKSDLPMTI